MSGNDRVLAGEEMPRLRAIRPAQGLAVEVEWDRGPRSGRSERVDLSPVVMTLRVFRPLRNDRSLFERVRLLDDGTAIGWGEDDLEMSVLTLERLASESMDNAEFRRFLERHGLTLDGAAAVLGIGRRMAAYFAADRPIPRTVALACRGYEAALDRARTAA